MNADGRLYGLLLCRAAGHRLAFPATQVVAVEHWSAADGFPHARSAYGALPEKGRTLITETGEAVAVDSVEVMAETLTVMPPPAILQHGLGGSLTGFCSARDALWPVLDVFTFSRFLSSRSSGGHA